MSKSVRTVVLITLGLMLGYFVYDALNQPGVEQLKGGFQEEAFYRNENNTGPIIRIYAVSVLAPETAELEAYGNFMPHTKYGNTKVYFFRKGNPIPKSLHPGESNFPERFQKYLIAKYEKD